MMAARAEENRPIWDGLRVFLEVLQKMSPVPFRTVLRSRGCAGTGHLKFCPRAEVRRCREPSSGRLKVREVGSAAHA